MDATKITKTEARALKSVVKGRFELLREQVEQARGEIGRVIRQRIEAEYAEKIEAANRQAENLQAKAKELEAEARKLQAGWREQGLMPADSWRNREKTYLTVTFADRIVPANIDEKVDREVGKLQSEAGLASMNLREKELDLLEQLAIGQLQTDDAHGFLEQIPSAENMLPAARQAGILNGPDDA